MTTEAVYEGSLAAANAIVSIVGEKEPFQGCPLCPYLQRLRHLQSGEQPALRWRLGGERSVRSRPGRSYRAG